MQEDICSNQTTHIGPRISTTIMTQAGAGNLFNLFPAPNADMIQSCLQTIRECRDAKQLEVTGMYALNGSAVIVLGMNDMDSDENLQWIQQHICSNRLLQIVLAKLGRKHVTEITNRQTSTVAEYFASGAKDPNQSTMGIKNWFLFMIRHKTTEEANMILKERGVDAPVAVTFAYKDAPVLFSKTSAREAKDQIRAMILAFAMGTHHRLGRNSLVNRLDDLLVALVAQTLKAMFPQNELVNEEDVDV